MRYNILFSICIEQNLRGGNDIFSSLKRRIVKNDVYCVVLVNILKCPACKQTLRTLFPVEINKKNTNYANIIKPLRSENGYGTQNIEIKKNNVRRVVFSRIKNVFRETKSADRSIVMTNDNNNAAFSS